MQKVRIGTKLIGPDEPVFITAEIGINHSGDISLAKKLIDMASEAGADAVKFQKRTVDVVYTKEELDTPRESPWGNTTREQKYGLEFDFKEYRTIDEYCKEKHIMWFASCWDKESVDFMYRFDPPCYKIPSALLTDDDLLRYVKSKGKPVILSTGMSTMKEIKNAVKTLGKNDLILLHCTSTYPSKSEELNINMIHTLKKKFPEIPIGYSGHETGVFPSTLAVAMGACMIERHITLDRAAYGSDQAASLERKGLETLIRDIRTIRTILGDGVKKVYDSEIPIKNKLRHL